MEKRCWKCKSIKDISEYNKNQSKCKSCIKEYYLLNKKRISEYKKKYRKDNLDFIAEKNKEYYLNNKKTL